MIPFSLLKQSDPKSIKLWESNKKVKLTFGEVTPLLVLPTALELSAISVIAMLFRVNWLTGPERSRCNAGRLKKIFQGMFFAKKVPSSPGDGVPSLCSGEGQKHVGSHPVVQITFRNCVLVTVYSCPAPLPGQL